MRGFRSLYSSSVNEAVFSLITQGDKTLLGGSLTAIGNRSPGAGCCGAAEAARSRGSVEAPVVVVVAGAVRQRRCQKVGVVGAAAERSGRRGSTRAAWWQSGVGGQSVSSKSVSQDKQHTG